MGKVGMSVLTKGLAMDFERQGRTDMAITSIWPAAVCVAYLIQCPYTYHGDSQSNLVLPEILT